MLRASANDPDYLTARLHGRRSRLAEGERLERLCSISNLLELGRAVYPETEFHAVGDFQRRLAQELVRELSGFLRHMEGPGAALLAWMLVRFQVENIKVLVRSFLCRTPLERPEEYLLSLPPGLLLDVPGLLAAASLEEFSQRLPGGPPRKHLLAALEIYREEPRPFFLEGALDCGYFQELLARTGALSGEDRELVQPILFQEVDAFHLMLVVRGKFHYGLTPDSILPFHVRWSGIPTERFTAMLAATDITTVANLAVGPAIDELPSGSGTGEGSATITPSSLEALARSRFLRLCKRAFRRSHMGLAAVVGYVGIRRVEVANLITLSEGIALGTAPEALRARMLPKPDLDSVYV